MKDLLRSVTAVIIALAVIPIYGASTSDKDIRKVNSLIKLSGFGVKESLLKAESLYPGVIYQYELEHEGDEFFHEIKLVDIENQEKIEVTFSLTDRSVSKLKKESLCSWFFEDERITMAKKLKETKSTLLSSIETVQLASEAVITEVELEYKNNYLYFELEADDVGREVEWLVDATTNSLVPDFKR